MSDHWTFWDRLAYTGLWIAAVFIAGDTGVRLSPHLASTLPDFPILHYMGFVPLLGLLFATGIFFAQKQGWIGAQKAKKNWGDSYRPQRIEGKTFANTRVPLDGHAYYHCTFNNVTFVYDGTTPVIFQHNTIGGCLIASDNPSIQAAFGMMLGLGFIRGGVGLAGESKTISRPTWIP